MEISEDEIEKLSHDSDFVKQQTGFGAINPQLIKQDSFGKVQSRKLQQKVSNFGQEEKSNEEPAPEDAPSDPKQAKKENKRKCMIKELNNNVAA